VNRNKVCVEEKKNQIYMCSIGKKIIELKYMQCTFLLCNKILHMFTDIAFLCRDIKEMNTSQARISVETAREVAGDKTLKTKGDKDRRLREKKQNNTKKFMDERKHAQIKQGKEKERLRKKHEMQLAELNKEIQNVSMLVVWPIKCEKM
jgi:hypothetical protein